MKQRGEMLEPVLILIGLVLIVFLFALPKHGVPGPAQNFTSLLGGGYTQQINGDSSSNGTGTQQNNSSYSNNVSLGTGNAPYEYQPLREYVSIGNQSNKTIDITGWKLRNNKDSKTYSAGNNLQHFPADTVVIPQAVLYISPTGNNVFGDIVLKSNETAIITTGKYGVTSPYRIVNFKENKCSGYLEALPDYEFTPPLQFNCSAPNQEPGYNNLDQTCQRFIDNFSSCHTPVYDGLDQNRELCNGCVDGKTGLANSCVAFIKSHYSYSGCIDNHKNDTNFELNQWRVFLGQTFELWGKDHEVISLFDQSGYQVSSSSY